MRNQRALAAACAAAATLGLAAPVAIADGMGNTNGDGPFYGNAGNGNGNGDGPFYGNAGIGGGPSNGNGGGYPGYGNLSGTFSDHGHFTDNGNRGFGDGGRGGSGRDPARGDDSGRGDDTGNGGRGDGIGGRRNIEAAPGAIESGDRLTVTVDDCRGGTVSSRAFPTAQLHPFRDDTSRAGPRIDQDARPGRYDITAHCDGRRVTHPSAFTVLGGVEGGAGGGTRSGATRTDTAIGAGLVAWAVVGGGVYWLRRRNEKRF
ncbi:hypothetical protein [Streptomyces roseochromogenus]|uniref:Integral membrane protein n=1 Tax=Streptomyces roseochromogenus subsp. oscitans DS 12.976 TaxID=1352936 RepID=V6KW16_STRRC|nr:hypothetical protein [Streptomyces roseochromogenus]EST35636.1 hypothetical protein M878_05055 [Streptomyces roseochromogenus subsp. oscitans DS 12.976]